jgi:hypothetical protein
MARRLFVASLIAALMAARSAHAQTVDGRPTVEVVIDNRAASAALELAAARTRARFIFDDAGVHLDFMTQGKGAAIARSGLDRIHLVVLDTASAERLIPTESRMLGFAIPSANRVYVHYDRVQAVARSRGVEPGWFLGVVIAHELGHVLLQGAAHTDSGVMARALSPDPKVPPAFTQQQARSLRSRLGAETTLAQR